MPGETLLSGSNPFPESMPQLEATVEAWVKKMKVFGMAVMTAMADGLGLGKKESEDLKQTMADTFWCMRLIGKSIRIDISNPQVIHRCRRMPKGSAAGCTRITVA